MNKKMAQALLDKAVTLHQAGHIEEAKAIYQSILRKQPKNADAHNYLGLAYHQQGDHEQGLRALRKAIALFAGNPHFHYNAGVVAQALGRLDEALEYYQSALRLKPDYALAYNNCGTIWRERGDDEKARSFYRQALEHDPRCVEALSNMAAIHRRDADSREMLAYCEAAIRENPNIAEAYINRGYALGRQNKIAEALDSFRQGLALQPNMPDEHSVLLMNMHYLEGYTSEQIFAEHVRWGQQHADPLFDPERGHDNDPDPHRRLRIGYISQDFFFHSVAYFFEPLMEYRDTSQFEVYCYSNVKEPDYITGRLRSRADVWREIKTKPALEVAEMIRADRIDILVDLSGHTPGNSLMALAYKPAPIQMTYIGYPDTTGMQAMDYRITDALADPIGVTDRWHTETLVRLKHGFLCYRPNDFAPAVAPLPALSKGYITFGSFNSFVKMSPACIALWSRILQQVPDSRLRLKYKYLTQDEVRRSILDQFSSHGIDVGRIELIDHIDRVEEHLGAYGDIDIALDTFPYNGTTTTCEALWMGVPVIALVGQSHVSRVGLSLLAHAGMPQLAAANEDEYVALAVALANQRQDLADIRAKLRPMMAGSDLTNGPLLVRSIEQAYRALWQHYVAGNVRDGHWRVGQQA